MREADKNEFVPNSIVINCGCLLQREEAHQYLAKQLELPDYYGANLDALYDCLTELGARTILLEQPDLLRRQGGYGEMILKVFEEAARENPGLTLFAGEEQSSGN